MKSHIRPMLDVEGVDLQEIGQYILQAQRPKEDEQTHVDTLILLHNKAGGSLAGALPVN